MIKNGDVLPYDLQGILNGNFKKSIFTAWLFSQVLPFYYITNPNHEKHYRKSLKKDL